VPVGGRELWVVRAGSVEYDAAVDLQERVHRARREEQVPDVLLLLSHPPVITCGRGARPEHLLSPPEQLAARGVAVREAGRGGDVTYHGPGQLVGYPIVSLTPFGRDVHRYLRTLEEVLIQALARFGVAGTRVPGRTGVWVGASKVAAIGIGVRRWISWHGFALNVSRDLDGFSLIVPCGLPDAGITSLGRLLDREVTEDEAAGAVVSGFECAFPCRATSVAIVALEALVGSAPGGPPGNGTLSSTPPLANT